MKIFASKIKKDLNTEEDSTQLDKNRIEEFSYTKFMANHGNATPLDRLKYVYLSSFLLIYLIPANVLSDYYYCKQFVYFMSKIFPNIQIFYKNSKIGEVLALYVSLTWILSVVFFIILLKAALKQFSLKRFSILFGADEYEDKGAIPKIFLPKVTKKTWQLFIVVALMAAMVCYFFYMYFTGKIVHYQIKDLHFYFIVIKDSNMKEFIQTRFYAMIVIAIMNTNIVYLGSIVTTLFIEIINTFQLKNKYFK